jgi:glyoxylase-like metal-dependent hydrolase (beta-lactamase superfamily II)
MQNNIIEILGFGNYTIFKLVTEDFLKENCYVVKNNSTNNAIIIDPGYNIEEITRLVQEYNMKAECILLTHAHFDHLGTSAELQASLDIPCNIHKSDKRLLVHADMYAQRFAGKRVKIPREMIYFESGYSFKFGEDDCSLIHTPGHSAGGVCIMFKGFIFTGDTLFFESIGRTDLPTGDIVQLSKSIDTIMDLDNAIILPGHGCNWTIKEAKAWWRRKRSIYLNNND